MLVHEASSVTGVDVCLLNSGLLEFYILQRPSRYAIKLPTGKFSEERENARLVDVGAVNARGMEGLRMLYWRQNS